MFNPITEEYEEPVFTINKCCQFTDAEFQEFLEFLDNASERVNKFKRYADRDKIQKFKQSLKVPGNIWYKRPEHQIQVDPNLCQEVFKILATTGVPFFGDFTYRVYVKAELLLSK